MQAALIVGKERIEFLEFEEPEVKNGAAVVRIDRCGICGTDLAAYRSGEYYTPFLCGHEWSGTVTHTHSAEQNVRDGDRVVMGVPVACGQCAECRQGIAHRCAKIMALAYGIHPLTPPHGGFAPYIAVPSESLIVVPSGLATDDAALVEPATVALHAVRRRPPQIGDTVVVLGAGPIGLFTLQWAYLAGAGQIIVIEPQLTRREIAQQLGATQVFAPGDEAEEMIRQYSHGLGADIVYECAGSQTSTDAAFRLLRPGGVLMFIGVSGTGVRLDPMACITKEITLDNSTAHHHHEFRITMDMMLDKRLQAALIHTQTIALDMLSEGFDELLQGKAGKILIDPHRIPGTGP